MRELEENSGFHKWKEKLRKATPKGSVWLPGEEVRENDPFGRAPTSSVAGESTSECVCSNVREANAKWMRGPEGGVVVARRMMGIQSLTPCVKFNPYLIVVGGNGSVKESALRGDDCDSVRANVTRSKMRDVTSNRRNLTMVVKEANAVKLATPPPPLTASSPTTKDGEKGTGSNLPVDVALTASLWQLMSGDDGPAAGRWRSIRDGGGWGPKRAPGSLLSRVIEYWQGRCGLECNDSGCTCQIKRKVEGGELCGGTSFIVGTTIARRVSFGLASDEAGRKYCEASGAVFSALVSTTGVIVLRRLEKTYIAGWVSHDFNSTTTSSGSLGCPGEDFVSSQRGPHFSHRRVYEGELDQNVHVVPSFTVGKQEWSLCPWLTEVLRFTPSVASEALGNLYDPQTKYVVGDVAGLRCHLHGLSAQRLNRVCVVDELDVAPSVNIKRGVDLLEDLKVRHKEGTRGHAHEHIRWLVRQCRWLLVAGMEEAAVTTDDNLGGSETAGAAGLDTLFRLVETSLDELDTPRVLGDDACQGSGEQKSTTESTHRRVMGRLRCLEHQHGQVPLFSVPQRESPVGLALIEHVQTMADQSLEIDAVADKGDVANSRLSTLTCTQCLCELEEAFIDEDDAPSMECDVCLQPILGVTSWTCISCDDDFDVCRACHDKEKQTLINGVDAKTEDESQRPSTTVGMNRLGEKEYSLAKSDVSPARRLLRLKEAQVASARQVNANHGRRIGCGARSRSFMSQSISRHREAAMTGHQAQRGSLADVMREVECVGRVPSKSQCRCGLEIDVCPVRQRAAPRKSPAPVSNPLRETARIPGARLGADLSCVFPMDAFGHRGFVLFVDEFSRYPWVHMMKGFSATEAVQGLSAVVGELRLLGYAVHTLRVDGGTVFRGELELAARALGIASEPTAADSQVHNNLAECTMKKVLETARSFLIGAAMDEMPFFWGEAVMAAVFWVRVLADKSLRRNHGCEISPAMALKPHAAKTSGRCAGVFGELYVATHLPSNYVKAYKLSGKAPEMVYLRPVMHGYAGRYYMPGQRTFISTAYANCVAAIAAPRAAPWTCLRKYIVSIADMRALAKTLGGGETSTSLLHLMDRHSSDTWELGSDGDQLQPGAASLQPEDRPGLELQALAGELIATETELSQTTQTVSEANSLAGLEHKSTAVDSRARGLGARGGGRLTDVKASGTQFDRPVLGEVALRVPKSVLESTGSSNSESVGTAQRRTSLRLGGTESDGGAVAKMLVDLVGRSVRRQHTVPIFPGGRRPSQNVRRATARRGESEVYDALLKTWHREVTTTGVILGYDTSTRTFELLWGTDDREPASLDQLSGYHVGDHVEEVPRSVCLLSVDPEDRDVHGYVDEWTDVAQTSVTSRSNPPHPAWFDKTRVTDSSWPSGESGALFEAMKAASGPGDQEIILEIRNALTVPHGQVPAGGTDNILLSRVPNREGTRLGMVTEVDDDRYKVCFFAEDGGEDFLEEWVASAELIERGWVPLPDESFRCQSKRHAEDTHSQRPSSHTEEFTNVVSLRDAVDLIADGMGTAEEIIGGVSRVESYDGCVEDEAAGSQDEGWLLGSATGSKEREDDVRGNVKARPRTAAVWSECIQAVRTGLHTTKETDAVELEVCAAIESLKKADQTLDPDEPTVAQALHPDNPKRGAWLLTIMKELRGIMSYNCFQLWARSAIPRGRHPIKSGMLLMKKYVRAVLQKLKARHYAAGFACREWLEYTPFAVSAPTPRFTTMRFIIALATMRDWGLMTGDVRQAFLHSLMTANAIWMEQARGLELMKEKLVVLLRRGLYGIPQAGALYYSHVRSAMLAQGYVCLEGDRCCYVKFTSPSGQNITHEMRSVAVHDEETIYGRPRGSTGPDGIAEFVSDDDPFGLMSHIAELPPGTETHLVAYYVDDVNACESRPGMTAELCKNLRDAGLSIDFYGPLEDVIGWEVTRREGSTTVKQTSKIEQLAKRLGYVDEAGKLVRDVKWKSPMEDSLELSMKMMKDSLMGEEERLFLENYDIRMVLGVLLHIYCSTRPSIGVALVQVAKLVNAARMLLVEVLRRVVEYLYLTRDRGLTYVRQADERVVVWCDASWNACPDTGRGRTGYLLIFGGAAISWGCRMQSLITLSSTESEVCALRECGSEILSVRKLTVVLTPVAAKEEIVVKEDNTSAIQFGENRGKYERTRHMSMRWHLVRELAHRRRIIKLEHCPTLDMLADPLTKSLSGPKHERFARQMLNYLFDDAQPLMGGVVWEVVNAQELAALKTKEEDIVKVDGGDPPPLSEKMMGKEDDSTVARENATMSSVLSVSIGVRTVRFARGTQFWERKTQKPCVSRRTLTNKE